MWRTGMCNEDSFNKNNYQYKIEMCVAPYVGERVKSENVCDSVLVEYNKSEIRNAFNRYMKLPIGCNIFNPESCEDYKDMKPKEVSKLPTNNTICETFAKLLRLNSSLNGFNLVKTFR